jgi:Fibronectin type III domain
VVNFPDVVPVTSVRYDHDQVTAEWPASIFPGVSYEATLSSAGREPVVQRVGAPWARFDASGLPRERRYEVSVRVIGADGALGPAGPAFPFALLDPPEGLRIVPHDDDRWQAVWSPARGATGYQFTVIDGSSGRILTDIRVTAPAPGQQPPTFADFDTSEYLRGVEYKAGVRAFLDDLPSDVSSGVPVMVLDAPGGVQARYDGGGIQISWSPVPGAPGYRVAVTDKNGVAVPGTPLSTSETTATVSGRALKRGSSYEVRVRGVAYKLPGPWSAAVPVTVP